jgi:glutathione S-transferase
MMVQMTTVGPMFGQYVHFMRFAPKNDYALDRYHQARRVLDVLEGRLSASPFLGGRRYSVADIATFPWARLVGPCWAAGRALSKVRAWVGHSGASGGGPRPGGGRRRADKRPNSTERMPGDGPAVRPRPPSVAAAADRLRRGPMTR